MKDEKKDNIQDDWQDGEIEFDWPGDEEPVESFSDELDEVDAVEPFSDESDLGDGWEEDEPEPMKPWAMALVFLGLVVLAAVICVILWRFTHTDQRGDSLSDGTVTENFEDTEAPDFDVPSDEKTSPSEGQTLSSDEQSFPSEEAGLPGDDAPQDPVDSSEPEPEEESGDTGREPDDVYVPETPKDGDGSMSFESVQESVTPKDLVNLRTIPSTADENTVVSQISNGEVLSRTGINRDTGWSRIDYNGQTLYAVTQYLTTDLTYKPPIKPSDPNRVNTIDGRVIIFVDCDDQLTPKEYVNLRTEPSTSEGEATVRCQVNHGETVHRTGFSADSGWSRVEYNGEVLYVVTSLMQAPQ